MISHLFPIAQNFNFIFFYLFIYLNQAQKSPTYGYITTTPKEGWKFTNVLGPLTIGLPTGFPVGFDTDVNAPAMAEFKYRR
jgi:fructokinase